MATDYSETYIYLFPNAGDVGAGDDWSSTSPFSGYTATSGFVLSNAYSHTPSAGYTFVPHKILEIGNINKKIDLFSGISVVSKTNEIKIKGVGGKVKTGDVSFQIENVNNTSPSCGKSFSEFDLSP